MSSIRFRSLIIHHALMELGVKEISGSAHNPRILEYHQTTSIKASSDEVPWCSSFLNWVLLQAGFKGTGSAAARSWLSFGREARPEEMVGSIIVLDRPTPDNKLSAHAGILWHDSAAGYVVLGGNQRDAVNFTTFKKIGLLGFRVMDDKNELVRPTT